MGPPAVDRRMSTSGAIRRNSSSRGMSQRMASVGSQEMDSRCLAGAFRSSSQAASSPENRASIRSANALPRPVRWTPRLRRSKSGNPKNSSNCRTARLTAPWVTCRSWAARVKLSCRAAARNEASEASGGRFFMILSVNITHIK